MSDELFLRFVLPAIFIVVGAGLLAAAIRRALRTRRFLALAREAVGEVVALDEEPATEPGDPWTYRPVVSFFTEGKRRVRFSALGHSSRPAYEVGASVRVLYDPQRPLEARIRSFGELWMPWVLLGGLGGIFTVLGVAILLDYIPL